MSTSHALRVKHAKIVRVKIAFCRFIIYRAEPFETQMRHAAVAVNHREERVAMAL